MSENAANEDYGRVKDYLLQLELNIVHEDADEELVVVEDEDAGIKNLVIDCEAPIVVLEQLILELQGDDAGVFKRLLQMNRTLVHGAFVVDEDGKYVFFRDTLQLANLDLNELEGSIAALSMGLAEHGDELLSFVKSE